VSVGDLARGPLEDALLRHLHRTIKVVTEDFESFAFNTAIARLMELVNQVYRYKSAGGAHPQVMRDVIENLLKMLAPMAPYLTEEQWQRRGHEGSIHDERWPDYDPSLVQEEEVVMVVQVDGKVRDTLRVPADIAEEEAVNMALRSEKVLAHLGGRAPVKVITKPPKLVSLVADR
jgi:leucyl-tRNA synthetase